MQFDDVRSREDRWIVDKLALIGDLLKEFVENWKKHYGLNEFMTIDEMLESFCRRCIFRKFIKNKPVNMV